MKRITSELMNGALILSLCAATFLNILYSVIGKGGNENDLRGCCMQSISVGCWHSHKHVTEGCWPDKSRIFFDASEECKAHVKRINETSDVNKGKKNGERTWLECFNKEIPVWSR